MSQACGHFPVEMRHLTQGIICHKCNRDRAKENPLRPFWLLVSGEEFKRSVERGETLPGVG